MVTFTTPRRSTRLAHQPIVNSPSKTVDASNYSWTRIEPLFSRKLDPDSDLLPEDREEFEKLDDQEKKELETRFYDQLRFKKANKGRKKAGVEYTTYSVGDTVLVNSSSRLPSVAVIVDMWELDLEREETDEKMRIRVHWFDRPTELPSIRAKRYYHDNEVYYSLSETTILFPSSIISPCTVKKGAAHAELAPSRTGRYILKSIDEVEQEFQCLLAVDARRGIFYEFDWTLLRKQALEARDDISDGDWGTGSAWNVTVKNEFKEKKKVEKKKKTPRASVSPRKRVKMEPASAEEEKNIKPTSRKPIPKTSRKSAPKRTVKVVDEVKPRSDEDSSGGSDEELYELSESESDDSDDSADSSESDLFSDKNDYDDEPRTPSRKRKRTTTSTPRKSRGRTIAHPTPHSKKALSRRNRSVTGSPTKKRTLPVKSQNTYAAHDNALRSLPEDPWLRAMHALHVGSRPDALPCRESEFELVHKSVAQLLEEGSGGCIYISGVPGTGKTATVHAVIRELKRLAENNEVNPFTYCEINGLRIPEPSAAYTLLWEVVSGHDVAKDGHLKMSAKESLKSLTRHFSGGGGRGRGSGSHACVVLMDELDQVMTAKQDVVYNFFNWPTIAGSKLVVIAVANTMNLPERMTGRVRSRLGMHTINFEPYKTPQLEEIVKARLATANESLSSSKAKELLTSDAIRFIAMKISSISGDARRALDVCRRTIELMRPAGRAARTNDVKDVIKEMQNSPTAAYLRECSLHERIMLASFIKCMRRDGIEEVKVGDLRYQHLIYVDSLTSGDEPTRKPSTNELRIVLESLVASRVMILEEGTMAMRKAETERKVVLNIDQSEVESALFEMNESWKQRLGES